MEKIVDELDKTVRLPGWRTCGCRRSATVSTCSPPASKARSALKFPALTWPISTPSAPGKLKAVARSVPGVTSALAERLVGGRYIDIDIQREKAARYGMTVGDVQLFVSSAIGGAMVAKRLRASSAIRSTSAIRRAIATARRPCASCRSSRR